MASIWRDPVIVTFVDADNHELARLSNPQLLPRVGENVRLGRVPYLVERIGYDVQDSALTAVWVVLAPA